MSIVGRDRLWWRRAGDFLTLHHGKSQRALAYVEPDPEWPGMFRVRSTCGITDMVNLTRAKDAAASIALDLLNLKAQETRAEAPRPSLEWRSEKRRKPQRLARATPDVSISLGSKSTRKLPPQTVLLQTA